MEPPSSYMVVGVMSGTSLDGVDMASCLFSRNGPHWTYSIQAAECVPYPDSWREALSGAFYAGAEALAVLDNEYGAYLGTLLNDFINRNKLKPMLIASHGHTVFHRPDEGYTLQIGDGNEIVKKTGVVTVNDFRSLDVSIGGQGAPLVPVGDKLLFPAFPVCLNIGGIANVSFDRNEKRIAFDICPANQVLDFLAKKSGMTYDANGDMARVGNVDKELLKALNALPFYKQAPPKSLGREWVESLVMPMIKQHQANVNDLLATFTEHIAEQISQSVVDLPSSRMLVTGGGAFNNYLIERLSKHTHHQVEIHEKDLVAFKEALVFALLGLLRWLGETNVYCSVTGAVSDSCSGKIHLPG
ncbi:MAG: anhydro-N-acetylmuramic acid kinase [Bacteroidetes bacterium]|nr:anhydro-N-acetylmuramic acid kinase [Bacteroidota bacterium]